MERGWDVWLDPRPEIDAVVDAKIQDLCNFLPVGWGKATVQYIRIFPECAPVRITSMRTLASFCKSAPTKQTGQGACCRSTIYLAATSRECGVCMAHTNSSLTVNETKELPAFNWRLAMAANAELHVRREMESSAIMNSQTTNGPLKICFSSNSFLHCRGNFQFYLGR